MRRTALQGRSLTGAKAPDKAADPIIVHPDVRRTLMGIRAFNEAARALVLWTALQADIGHRSEDAAERQRAEDHMGLMTPVVKGVLTEPGLRQRGGGPAALRRPRLTSRNGVCRSSCAMPVSP